MATASFHVLFESSSGYALFSVLEQEEIGALLDEVQRAALDFSRLQRTVKLAAFQPFTSAENALENINAISENEMTDDLKNFLELKLAKSKTKDGALAVISPNLGTVIQEQLGISCRADDTSREIIRAIRQHFSKFIKELDNGLLEKAQLGLGHSYSRAKVKFNPGRADNMIIQSIALLDQVNYSIVPVVMYMRNALDKDINTFAMRVREWYSWHFPELKDLVKDNYIFARVASFVGDKSSLSDVEESKAEGLAAILGGDEILARAVIHASRTSMGMDTSVPDMQNIVQFTGRMVKLAEYRMQVYSYLCEKMGTVAPNLSTLIGETVAARLIQKAGSLTNLAKCPASTVQILGAEKALFRALKTKGNTPKYGLIYHSTFIGRAGPKNKGRISRYLANKCAIASRIDSFIDEPTNKYGEELREQVEERLKFYDTGETPRKNVDVMHKVAQTLKEDMVPVIKEEPAIMPKKKKKKRQAEAETEEAEGADEEEVKPPKKKKRKAAELESTMEAADEPPGKPKMKTKKKMKVEE